MICSSSVALLKGGQSIAEASEGLIGQQLDLLASVLHQRLKQGDPKHWLIFSALPSLRQNFSLGSQDISDMLELAMSHFPDSVLVLLYWEISLT